VERDPSEFGKTIQNRLGTGELGTPEDFANAARERFIREIESSAQIALRSLLETVWPEFVRARTEVQGAGVTKSVGLDSLPASFRWPCFLRETVDQWAAHFHLVQRDQTPRWLIAQLESTFDMWARYPALIQGEQLCWASVYTGHWTVDKLPPEAVTISFPMFSWHPRSGYESRDGAKNRILDEVKGILTKRLDEIEELAIRNGLQTAPAYRETAHFNWAVRYQVLFERVTEIASSPAAAGSDVRAINSGIKKVLSLLGISRRPEKPGPVRAR
jgi:hypothetical protein